MRPVVVNKGNGFYTSSPSSALSSLSSFESKSVCWTTTRRRRRRFRLVIVAAAETLKVMISGAPGSGKGTQSQMIAHKFGLVHISVPDSDSDDDLIGAVRARLSEEEEKGWVLDGYLRTATQARALPRPDIFIQLDGVPDATLIQRCVGRRLLYLS